MSEVSTLLARSRAAHADYQKANRNGNPVLEKISIVAAQDFRDKAHALDPQHTDLSWEDDPVSSETISDFYSLYLKEGNYIHDSLATLAQPEGSAKATN